MKHVGRNLALRPILSEPPASADPSTRGDLPGVVAYGHHAEFCQRLSVWAVADHSPLCRSRISLLAELSDPTGGVHELIVERVCQYTHGAYDRDQWRDGNDDHTFVRLGIDMSDDPDVDVAEGLILSSGDARQLAAVLIAEADRADGILPNT